MQCFQAWFQGNIAFLPLFIRVIKNRQLSACLSSFGIFL